jgi:alpha-mannosidase
MNRFPEHRFSATQAQQFKWLEELYPELFDKLKERVAEGKFQPLGATWVEMDVNMPSGESLVRQFLYGQRYFESRFGIRSDTFVLPDTCELRIFFSNRIRDSAYHIVGYSSQLPQIARSAGARNFFTQKLSWNHE